MQNKNIELEEVAKLKLEFLTSAISNISSYIQLYDLKVSIIMATISTLFTGAVTFCKAFLYTIRSSPLSNLFMIIITFLSVLLLISFIFIFIFGMQTIRSHSSNITYKSKWFLPQLTEEYDFDAYKKDVQEMTVENVIENMAVEIYKLNDINRQKAKMYKGVIFFFSSTVLISIMIFTLIVTVSLRGGIL